MEVFSKYVAVLITVFSLFIGTSFISANLYDEVTLERVKTIAVKFTSEVREQGKITPSMYESFIRELDATGNLYNIDMVYSKNVVVPGGASEEAMTTSESFYTNDIVAGIYNAEADGGASIDGAADREVHFTEGSYFSLSVTNRGTTLFQKVSNLVGVRSASAPRIEVHSGGEIRDENW